jgi:menaquinone-dependent protoporphyrinogen oxidase
MGGTKGIAETIGAELAAAGLEVAIRDATTINSVDGYDAVVLGSAIYTSQSTAGPHRAVARRNAGAETW